MAIDAMGNYIGEYDDTTVYETEEERRKRLEAEAKKRGETVATEEKVIHYEDGSKTVETKREVPAGAVAPSMGDRIQSAGQRFVNNVQNAPQNFADNLNRGIENIKQAPENFVNNVGAVNPADVFKQMQQIESGNRDFDAQGRPIQSPVGAMYKNQVMPATAKNPGYGIVPARDNSPEEYNRVGQEYFQAMLKQFGGDTQKAAAAYNAGPGRVQQNMRANQGEMNVAQLPKETQGYLQKLGNLVGSVIPSAQAAPAPQNVRAQAFPEEGVAVATPTGVQGTQSIMGPVSPEQVQQQAQNEMQGLQQYVNPNAQPEQQPQGGMDFVNPDEAAMAADKAQSYLQSQTAAINRYTEAQNDPLALIQLREDSTQPAWIRQSAGTRVAEMITSENNRVAAENALPKMTPSELAKVATKKSSGNSVGDWLQYLLFKHVGLNDLANEKGEQLGIGHKWESVTDDAGKNGIVKLSASGRPLEGIKDDGSAMSQAELVAFGTGGKKVTKPDVSTQDVEATIDGKQIKGRVVTTFDKNNKPTTKVESGGKFYDYTGDWKPTSIATAAEKAEQASAIKLRYAGPTSYTEAGAKAAGEFNFNNGTNIGYASQTPGAPLVDLNTGKVVKQDANGVIQATQSGTPGQAPAPAAATAAQTGQTPSQITQGQAVSKVAQEQFVKTTVPAVLEQGNNGREIATARRQQIAIIENNPSILDIYNGSGDNYDKGRNVITKLLTGVYNENNSGDFYKDVKATGLDQNQRAAIEQMWNLTQGINGKTLKTNTGGGPVSNADMRTNQAANLQNFTETTPLGALQVINRSKFMGDLDAAKSAFIAKNPGLTDDVKFNSEWSKESARYTKAYEGIADARAQFLKPFAPPKDATKEQLSAFRDKVFKSFEMYPVPAYDTELGKWSYGTANAERAAAKKLLGR